VLDKLKLTTLSALILLCFIGLGGWQTAQANTTSSFDSSLYSQQVVFVGIPAQIPITVDPGSNVTKLQIAAKTLPGGAILANAAKNSAGLWQALLSWTPTAAQTGVNTVTFNATDNQGGSLSYTITFTVLSNPSVINRILAIRPKMMTIGNSINAFNALGDIGGGNTWGADGHLTWFHAKTNAGFDRARSESYHWSIGGGIDTFACYYFGGAVLNLQGGHSMLSQIPAAMSYLIDTPDIVYLTNVTENDLGQGYTPAVIESAITQTIKLIQSKWPNVLILISTPSPSLSYNTPTLHSNVAAVSAFIQALPNSYENLLVEHNVSTLLSGTVDQPNPSYVVDVIHPNERGALVRANGLYHQYGWLFPNALQIPTAAYNPVSPGQSLQYNPVFAAIGGPAEYTGSVTGLTIDHQYNSYEWYLPANYIATVSQVSKSGGLNVTLGATGPVSSQGGLAFDSDWGSGYYLHLPQVNPANYYFGAMQVKVINPVNLFGFGFESNLIGGVENNLTAIRFEGTFAAAHPEGLSDIFKAGDTFTFVTPTAMPGSTNTSVVNYGNVFGTNGITAGKPATYPTVQILAQNLLAVPTASPKFAAGMASQQKLVANTAFSYNVTIIPDAQTSNVLLTATGLPSGASLGQPVLSNSQLVAKLSWTPSTAQKGKSFPITLLVQDNLSGAEPVTFNLTLVVSP